MPTPESVLQDLNARLDLPARQRALLLRELRADFEGLVTSLVAGGLSTEAAVARAVRLLTPTADDADVLTGLHRSRYARLVARWQPTRVRILERTGIAAMAVVAVLGPALTLARVSRLSPLTLGLLGSVSVLVLANLAWQAFRIVVRRDARASDLAHAGKIQAGLVGLTLSAGALVVVMEVYRAVGVWSTSTVVSTVLVARTLATCAGAAALALGVTILGVFGALALLQWHVSARSLEEELDALVGSMNQPERRN